MTENDYRLLYDIASKRITDLERENAELKACANISDCSIKNEYTLPKDLLGLWKQTICEIRSEIKSWDLVGPHTEQYATSLCDKLEHSMCALAGGPYDLQYSIEEEIDE